MKAIVLKAFGPVDNLVIKEIPTPHISAGEVLVKVKAISINPVDVKTRSGSGFSQALKDFDPIILGWDISGVVVASESPLFKVNDAVFGMVNFPGHGKAYAEYVAVPADQLALKPDNITHEEAAAATLTALTAWQAMVGNGNILPGQKVLIHAAAGGVGHFAVQIAKGLGAYVIGTSSAANKDALLELGVDQHIDYTSQHLKDHVNGVDYTLDAVGVQAVADSLEIINPGGTLISINGATREVIADMAKPFQVNGKFVLVHSNGKDMQELASWLRDGRLRPIVAAVFPFDEMGKAHLQVETSRTVGKVVVRVD
ncbi:NADP-dependent oxidoreductase [Chitinophaga sp. Cy-1792]|uniref:NADP-dependent oxidoreductase n=1 Tax=Chitinophaga sp. Cy-1792 TaxID=2608339 RepID=UPI00142193FF|nr:NADP-dependent oxidoreductase [Chitinophaga sp. Cy-1792]NIG54574.1 NADP-dependent oxidoreductase [Chitinophaga sp. Cy-1792]